MSVVTRASIVVSMLRSDTYSTSPPRGNLVDGLPRAPSYAIGLRKIRFKIRLMEPKNVKKMKNLIKFKGAFKLIRDRFKSLSRTAWWVSA